jgi:hypothetical protein
MRGGALLLALAGLGGCAGESGLPEGEAVSCALAGAADFSQSCVLERLDQTGASFAIHHPDGAFRRFTFDAAQDAIALADGAESLVMSEGSDPGEALLAVGADRYRVKRAWLGRAAE